MDLYDNLAYTTSRKLTLAYSTSFGISTRLFAKDIRQHIYAIYGLVRIGDEIVDTYTGDDQKALLDELEAETYSALNRGYSTNLVVHAFALTARRYGITKSLIAPFFESMRLDLVPRKYNQTLYRTYIYGSAEVVGLMCLRVFCNGSDVFYDSLENGAKALGSAYQKINFLRDFASDYHALHRVYFPGVSFESFDDTIKSRIVKDIAHDIAVAKESLVRLPKSSRVAVSTSLAYYSRLLTLLEKTPAAHIKKQRIRVNNAHKLVLLASTAVSESRKK